MSHLNQKQTISYLTYLLYRPLLHHFCLPQSIKPFKSIHTVIMNILVNRAAKQPMQGLKHTHMRINTLLLTAIYKRHIAHPPLALLSAQRSVLLQGEISN